MVASTIGAEQAWRVIDDYATAIRVRADRPGFVHFGPPPRRRHGGSLVPRQTMVIEQKIAVSAGQLLLRDVAVTADGGTLRYRQHLEAPSSGQLPRLFSRPVGFSWRVKPPEVIDSEGNRLAVRSGSGGADGDGYVNGELQLRGTIAPQAAWLEIDGTRVDLDRRTARSEVRIEALEDRSPVERFLWRRLAVPDLAGLDPRAKRLDLLLCVDSHQAVVSVSLPNGGEHRRSAIGGPVSRRPRSQSRAADACTPCVGRPVG